MREGLGFFIIGLVLLAVLIPLPSQAINTDGDYVPITVEYSPGEEITELRDQYSRTHMGEDGNFVLTSYIGSIHYEDGNGDFQPIDTTITSSRKSGWDWEVETGHWQLYVKNDTTVGVKKGNNWIGHRFHGIAYLDIGTKEYTILQTTYEGIRAVIGNKIEWQEILYGIDYRLYYNNDSLKEDIVVKQKLRDLLNSDGYRPADFGHNAQSTFLVPIFECRWSQSLPMKFKGGDIVNPDLTETEQAIYFESDIEDPYWKTKLVSFLPVGEAVSANPINPEDPEEEWEYAREKIRKRLIKKNDKHWLLMGVRVIALNQMPEGAIVFDPTETLRPDGAGSETTLAIGGGTPAATNWQSVDEAVADNDTTYVWNFGATYERDLYGLPTSSGSGVINSIKIYFRCKKNVAGGGNVKPSLKSNSTVTDGTEVALDGDWTTYSQQWNTNPADAGAWERADIDALQIGVSLESLGGSPAAYCTQVYVEVDYTPPPDPPTNIDATDGDHTDKVVITWTKSDNASKYEVFRDGGGLGVLGDVATYDDSGATAGTITNAGTVTASDGTQTAHVVLSLASEATGTTTHSYTVKAGNAAGWSGASGADNGNRGVGAITYQWQRSAGDADAGYGNIGGATTDPYNDVAAPEGTISNAGTVTATSGVHTDKVVLSLAGEATTNGAGRYYQCIVSSTGASNSPQTSDNNRGYRGVGAITYQWQRSDGDSDANYNTNLGTTDPYNDTAAPAPTITAGTASASDGAYVAYVVLSLAGESTTDGAGRHFQCIVSAVDASNSPQTSDNNRGYRTVGAITYQWQRSAADSDASYSNIGGGTTDPYNDTGAPADGGGRYFKCLLDASGATQQGSAVDRGYRIGSPAVTTLEASSVKETTATISGNITSVTGANATSRGFQWDIDTGVPYADNWTENGNWASGVFSHGITGLTKGELYYFRAGAYNVASWGWGSEDTFLTKPDAPSGLEVVRDNNQEDNILTWTKGQGTQNTYIRGKEDSYPADRADGTLLYNNTGTTYTHTSVDGGMWYYSMWSYATEGGLEEYSDSYARVENKRGIVEFQEGILAFFIPFLLLFAPIVIILAVPNKLLGVVIGIISYVVLLQMLPTFYDLLGG